MSKIDPENPATVPAEWRPRMLAAAKRMAPGEGYDIGIEGNRELAETGVLQMLTDLLALAHNDGCIAAGWAFERLAPKGPVPQ